MNQPNKQTTASKGPGGLAWVWGVLGGVVFIGLIGLCALLYTMYQGEKAVRQQHDQTLAELAQKPPGGDPTPPTSVKIAQVATATMQERVIVVGRLLEVKRSTVASEIEGRVTELLAPAGRGVVGGETVIARVDPVWSSLAVEQARADLAAAEATARQSARELKLLEDLASRNATDPQAVDDARAEAESDAASVLAFKAALNRAEETSKRVEIIAPFDGVVSAKLTEKGQWLDPGSPVVEVVSNGKIDAVIDVPEQIITQVPKGTEIELEIVPLGLTITGKVVAINPDGSNAARTYPVKVRVDDRGGLLKVGMSVTARVPVRAEKEYLVVPRDAVQYADTGPRVWMSLVMPASAPGSMPQGLPMDVDVLFGVDGKFAIEPKPKLEGVNLMPGMDVVVEGAERLWPTRPVIVMNGGEAGGEGAPR
ncbi:MAG: efflux RND transporter periplasmic adaptor subunit [Phycisphaeraceae bacterium]|nr:efflux RND transporter periplasmic adaptor subunit [Phycisphaeraceae bacterium]